MAEKYGQPRRTEILYDAQETAARGGGRRCRITRSHVFVSKEGYFKKITAQSLRMSGEQKFKEGDSLSFSRGRPPTGRNFWYSPTGTRCYKSRLSDFDDGKAVPAGRLPAPEAGLRGGRKSGGAGVLRAITRASSCSSLKTARRRRFRCPPTRRRPTGRSSPALTATRVR